jgi:RimJ/RimL family protein N-acetyltransferase
MTPEPRISSIGAESSAQDSAPNIQTDRLELIAITPSMLRADFTKSPEFSQLTHAEVPDDWPAEGWDKDAYDYLFARMEKYPDYRGWSRYIGVKVRNRGRVTLAGACGLTEPIELTGDPEIGYGLLPAFQHQGYATEAVAALVAWIFEHPHVHSVNAQTFPGLQASIRVLVKNGFQFAGRGPGPEEGTVLYRKWRE